MYSNSLSLPAVLSLADPNKLSRMYVKPAYEDAPCNIACGPPRDIEDDCEYHVQLLSENDALQT